MRAVFFPGGYRGSVGSENSGARKVSTGVSILANIQYFCWYNFHFTNHLKCYPNTAEMLQCHLKWKITIQYSAWFWKDFSPTKLFPNRRPVPYITLVHPDPWISIVHPWISISWIQRIHFQVVFLLWFFGGSNENPPTFLPNLSRTTIESIQKFLFCDFSSKTNKEVGKNNTWMFQEVSIKG